jgi:hypothetical protein
MTIYWVNSPTDSALDAMEAVERALEAGDTGLAPRAAATEPEPLDLTAGDSYLAENLELLHASWSVDPNQIVMSNRPYLGWAINRFQGLLRKATWWYTQPQLAQIVAFHAASVRVTDSLLEQQRQLRQRVQALENPHTVDRLQAIEEQIRGLRAELEALRRELPSPPAPAPQRARAATQPRQSQQSEGQPKGTKRTRSTKNK